MHGNQGFEMARRLQETYEARATQIQQHIWRLQDEHEKLAAEAPSISDFTQYDHRTHLQLDAELRVSIDRIRTCITDYSRAVSDWDALIHNHRLQEDNSAWSQLQLREHAAFFGDPSLAPSLYYKFCELMHIYQDARHHLEPFLQQTTSSATLADRRTLGPLPESQSPSSRTVTAQLPPATAVRSPPASSLPLPSNDRSDRHHFYAQASRKYTKVLEMSASSGFAWSSLANRSGPSGSSGPSRPPTPYRQQRQRSGSRDRNQGQGMSSQQHRPGGYVADADTILVADFQDAPEVCTLCNLQHSSADCTFYTTVYMRQ